MLLGRDVAEHARAVVARGGGADAARDVVVAREDVGHERPEHVERRAVAELALQLHVVLDLIKGHVSRALDHDLDIVLPGQVGEFSQRAQFAELRFVVGVID